ncbi:MAG: Rieske (2Fe-2S) protein, partial [bacterium]
GWGQGLTILTCMMNLLPRLAGEERARALYHGLSAVANDCDGAPPRFELGPLPDAPSDFATLKRWLRQLVEVRDADGAERCVATAIRAGANPAQMADMLFAAATDHRYIQIGHPLDFTNKAFEALDLAGWSHAEPVLTSLVGNYTRADRMEESNAWRHPADLVSILEQAFDRLPTALEEGSHPSRKWIGHSELASAVLGETPQAIVDALLDGVRQGASAADLAGAVVYAAALRIAQFHTSNEFGDWDTALHSFTFANAVHQGLYRVPSIELLRGVFDAAMSVYLDRFLNVPPARLPDSQDKTADPETILGEWAGLLNRQQQVNEAGELVSRYLNNDGAPERLIATLGQLLLREDRNFHTIQCMEAAVRQVSDGAQPDVRIPILVAAARYLAAHAPTMRAQGQTYQIAYRLHRGERLFEDA